MAKKDTWLSLPFRFSQEVDRLFDELIYRPWRSPLRGKVEEWNPELDLYETTDAFIVEVDLPGVKERDVSVQLEENELVLSGHRVCERVTEQRNVHRLERHEGHFTRRLQLPASVAHDKIRAEFKEGVLRVTIPKISGERKDAR
jgi:HSP20 family protein